MPPKNMLGCAYIEWAIQLDAIELTVSRLQRTAQRQQERLRLLAAHSSRADEAAEIAKRRQALRERFAKKLAEADAAAVELLETVARAVVLFRKIIDIRETARAAWPTAATRTITLPPVRSKARHYQAAP